MAKTSPQLLQIVGVCREFQKYTGSDNQIVYNINSKYAPKFHIHPALLASDFFQRRQQFYHKLKGVVNTVNTNKELLDYLEDQEVSFMLHHFGIETVIKKLKQYKKETKKKKHNIDNDKDLFDIDTDFDDFDETTREKISLFDKLSKRPLQFLLFCFLKVRDLQKVNNKSVEDMRILCEMMVFFGVGASQHHRKLFKMIRSLSSSQLQKKLKSVKIIMNKGLKEGYNVNNKQLIVMCNDLRSWTKNGSQGISKIANDFKHKSMELMSVYFFKYDDCKLCHYPHLHNMHNYINHGTEILKSPFVCSQYISNNFHYAKTIGVVKICVSNDLISRIDEMVNIGIGCIACKEWYIALKVLRCSYRLSSGYIENKKWIDFKCEEEMDKVNGIWWKSRCKHCKVKALDIKHKACTGCMKVVYCSRQCQKLDWNIRHRNVCDGSWLSIYGVLKMTILDRM